MIGASLALGNIRGPVIVTGAAGFVGFHVASRLLLSDIEVIGVDCFSPYYDLQLKEARFSILKGKPTFLEERLDLIDTAAVDSLFKRYCPSCVIHLAAQPGVRLAL